jgi:hypothetical protein
LRPGDDFFAQDGIFLSVHILLMKACYGKKFEIKIVVAVGGSSWYTFLEACYVFSPPQAQNLGENFGALTVAAVGGSSWYTFFESVLCF